MWTFRVLVGVAVKVFLLLAFFSAGWLITNAPAYLSWMNAGGVALGTVALFVMDWYYRWLYFGSMRDDEEGRRS